MQNNLAIAIEEAKKMIKEWESDDDFLYGLYETERYIINKLIERLEVLSEESVPQDDGWISVSERLPEESGYCIVNSGQYIFRACHSKTDYTWYNLEYSDEVMMNITHWQPLPLPPKQ